MAAHAASEIVQMEAALGKVTRDLADQLRTIVEAELESRIAELDRREQELKAREEALRLREQALLNSGEADAGTRTVPLASVNSKTVNGVAAKASLFQVQKSSSPSSTPVTQTRVAKQSSLFEGARSPSPDSSPDAENRDVKPSLFQVQKTYSRDSIPVAQSRDEKPSLFQDHNSQTPDSNQVGQSLDLKPKPSLFQVQRSPLSDSDQAVQSRDVKPSLFQASTAKQPGPNSTTSLQPGKRSEAPAATSTLPVSATAELSSASAGSAHDLKDLFEKKVEAIRRASKSPERRSSWRPVNNELPLPNDEGKASFRAHEAPFNRSVRTVGVGVPKERRSLQDLLKADEMRHMVS